MLKVTILPQSQGVAVVTFPDVFTAAECAFQLFTKGSQMAGIEILDDVQMRCVNKSGSTTRKWVELPTLFIKFAGTPTAVKEHVEHARAVAADNRNLNFEYAEDADEAAELWSARKEALWSIMSMRRSEKDHVWTTDVAVPISRLADIIKAAKDDLSTSGLLGGIGGHVGDGNFHTFLLFNEDERETAEGVVHRMVKRAVEMEGTVTGEHGVGLIKRDYLPHELGDSTVDAMRRLKQAFDPYCLLNCDKVVRITQPRGDEVKPW